MTVYHAIDLDEAARWVRLGVSPTPEGLDLVAVVEGDDLPEGLAQTIHDEGDPWTRYEGVKVFGSPYGKRSTQAGDVFVTGDGICWLVMDEGFAPLTELRLPYMPEKRMETERAR